MVVFIKKTVNLFFFSSDDFVNWKRNFHTFVFDSALSFI